MSILYYSNRGILPDVNACLFTVERQNKQKARGEGRGVSSFLRDDFLAVGTLLLGDTDGGMGGKKNETKQKTMPYFTLWISGDSWSLCPRGFPLGCSRGAVLFFMPFSCVAVS